MIYSQVGIAIDASVETVAWIRVGKITIRFRTNELILLKLSIKYLDFIDYVMNVCMMGLYWTISVAALVEVLERSAVGTDSVNNCWK